MWVARIAQLSSFSWQTSVPRWQMFFIIIKIFYHLIVFIRWHWTPYRFWEEMATWMTILQVLNFIIFLFVVIMVNLSFNDYPAGIKHYSIITANIIKNTIMILLIVFTMIWNHFQGAIFEMQRFTKLGRELRRWLSFTMCLEIWHFIFKSNICEDLFSQIRKLIIGRAINAEYRKRWKLISFQCFFGSTIHRMSTNAQPFKLLFCGNWF